MGVSIRTLAGQLPDTAETLYTVPAGVKAYVNSLDVYCTAGIETVVLYRTIDGVTTTIASIPLDTGERIEGKKFGLKAGDTIDGETTTAATVDYTIEIVEDNE